jgi:IKI3 family
MGLCGRRAALGGYELGLAYMVITASQRDPGEYMLQLQVGVQTTLIVWSTFLEYVHALSCSESLLLGCDVPLHIGHQRLAHAQHPGRTCAPQRRLRSRSC